MSEKFKITSAMDFYLISLFLKGLDEMLEGNYERDRLTFLIMSVPLDELRDAAIDFSNNPF